jgi:hypothetical protein
MAPSELDGSGERSPLKLLIQRCSPFDGTQVALFPACLTRQWLVRKTILMALTRETAVKSMRRPLTQEASRINSRQRETGVDCVHGQELSKQPKLRITSPRPCDTSSVAKLAIAGPTQTDSPRRFTRFIRFAISQNESERVLMRALLCRAWASFNGI